VILRVALTVLALWSLSSCGRPTEESPGEVRRFVGHTGGVWAAAVSEDGSRVASGGFDKTVRIWDVASGAEARRIEAKCGYVTSLAFAREGTRLVTTGTSGAIRTWDLSTGAQLDIMESSSMDLQGRSREAAPILALAVSGDGRWIAFGTSGSPSIWVWDTGAKADDGARLRSFRGHTGDVMALAFTRPATRLISGSSDRTVRVWEVDTGKEALVLHGHSDPVYCLAVSADGRWAVSGPRSGDASGGSDFARFWDLGAGKEVVRFAGPAWSIALSPDGRRALTCGDDHAIQYWELATGKEIRKFEERTSRGTFRSVVFTAGGRRAISGSGGAGLIEWKTGETTEAYWDSGDAKEDDRSVRLWSLGP
jgi:WD40 repeat protein